MGTVILLPQACVRKGQRDVPTQHATTGLARRDFQRISPRLPTVADRCRRKQRRTKAGRPMPHTCTWLHLSPGWLRREKPPLQLGPVHRARVNCQTPKVQVGPGHRRAPRLRQVCLVRRARGPTPTSGTGQQPPHSDECSTRGGRKEPSATAHAPRKGAAFASCLTQQQHLALRPHGDPAEKASWLQLRDEAMKAQRGRVLAQKHQQRGQGQDACPGPVRPTAHSPQPGAEVAGDGDRLVSTP